MFLADMISHLGSTFPNMCPSCQEPIDKIDKRGVIQRGSALAHNSIGMIGNCEVTVMLVSREIRRLATEIDIVFETLNVSQHRSIVCEP